MYYTGSTLYSKEAAPEPWGLRGNAQVQRSLSAHTHIPFFEVEGFSCRVGEPLCKCLLVGSPAMPEGATSCCGPRALWLQAHDSGDGSINGASLT